MKTTSLPHAESACSCGWKFAGRVAFLLAFSVSSLSTLPAHAWGRLGHRVSAKLAESRLTPTARAAVRELLEPGESLADAATWADENRRDLPGTTSWHFVNVPIEVTRYNARYCHGDACVVSKIHHFRHVLVDSHASREDRQKALRFLVHFIQDVHQPLHVGDHHDHGGNDLQVQFFREGTNLHRLWDSGLIDRSRLRESDWVRELGATITPEVEVRWARSPVEEWADESLAAARDAYRVPGSKETVRDGERLSEAYLDANLPVARQRLAQAGVRVAVWLNAIWK